MQMTERTQVLLTPSQRAKAERLATRERTSIGAVLRAALDAYEGSSDSSRAGAVEDLLGMDVPAEEWSSVKEQIIAAKVASSRSG